MLGQDCHGTPLYPGDLCLVIAPVPTDLANYFGVNQGTQVVANLLPPYYQGEHTICIKEIYKNGWWDSCLACDGEDLMKISSHEKQQQKEGEKECSTS